MIIQDLSFAVDPGQLVAITGKSGCGKSTLLKILLALEKPKAGQVLLDGMAVADIGADRIRQRVAAVLHSDSLLAGDIAYNINLGIDPFDDKRLITACERAGIFETISDLPLGFSTQIGEMGSIFSAGQVQRLLVARALYRLPDVLVLDEALSHLGNKAARFAAIQYKETRHYGDSGHSQSPAYRPCQTRRSQLNRSARAVIRFDKCGAVRW